MPLFRSIVWVLGTLLSFAAVAYSTDPDPINDFCHLFNHMSRIPSSLLIRSRSRFPDRRWECIVVQKDDILYILGGYLTYSSPYQAYNGPSLYTHECIIFSQFFKLTIQQYV